MSVQVWKAAGMDMTNVQFLWASDEINAHANDYWLRVMDIARSFNVPRVVRCCAIMGRKEEDDLTAAQIFYPCMQCADVFFLKADICQLGMDQRKVCVVRVCPIYTEIVSAKLAPKQDANAYSLSAGEHARSGVLRCCHAQNQVQAHHFVAP